MSNALYTTSALSTGDARNGHVRSEDGLLDLDLVHPKSLGGAGDKTNPEQLFAAGYAACFHSALKHIARSRKITLAHSEVENQVSLHQAEDKSFFLSAALTVRLGGVDQATAEELARQAHQTCPYSNAVRGNIDVALNVTVE
ncbi:organic hydroperoxide resistance protein [Thauera sinica]|uniref:Organic hydroperoxide resistance protein n=1 Tax=Thauera sinica TaxID=2665146 RepID=A0ABW1AUI3_9RHOO|nr:organic hydroperoxide resistance protein [Thauera sp. K11]ATE62467.1 organic hydroperoxide resistance protein [Thauera sp. K11]